MKRLLTLIVLTAICLPLSAQTIKGTLSDLETGEAIPFANVVLEGTRYGAATDINGFYLINKMPECKPDAKLLEHQQKLYLRIR